MPISDDEKRKIIIGILNVCAKTGASISKINKDFEEQTGEKIALTQADGIEFMQTISQVYCKDFIYFSCSEKSKHITKLVAEQNVKISSNYMGNRNRYNPNSYRFFPSSRPVVSYGTQYADVSIPNVPSVVVPRKIQNRRQTLGSMAGNRSHSSHSPEPSNRRCATPNRQPATKRHRSRSRSPRGWFGRSPSRSRDRSPRRYRRSRSRSWSRPRARSVSRNRSPPRKRKNSNSPRQHNKSPTRQQGRSRSPSRYQNTSPNRKPPIPNNESHSRTPMQNSAKPTTSAVLKNDRKLKKFKFTVVADGCLFYMLSDMQCDLKTRLSLSNHSLTIGDAIKMVDLQKAILQQKRRKVLISIGASDIRNGAALFDMKRDFSNLFMRCEELGLKPLITSVICFDSPELKAKADIFNEFLIDCFENVIDMRQVIRSGMSDIMTSLNKRFFVTQRNILELGAQQQLILNINQN